MSERPTIEFRPKDRRNPDSTWLNKHGRNVTSHAGEDGIIEKIFEVIGIESKFCIEFGAADGKHFSNTFNLVRFGGWSGLMIEPGPQFDKLKDLYKGSERIECVKAFVGFTPEDNLDAHFQRSTVAAGRRPDFCSIDVDGCEIYIWEDMKVCRPRVVCVEFNHFIPLDVYFVQPKDMEMNAGSSLLAIAEKGKELGYELVAVTGANAIFVDRPLFPKLNIPDNSVEAMHFLGPNETKIIQAYDGTLYIAGLNAHPWKGYLIDEERIQVLPSNLRAWKFDGRIWPSTKL